MAKPFERDIPRYPTFYDANLGMQVPAETSPSEMPTAESSVFLNPDLTLAADLTAQYISRDSNSKRRGELTYSIKRMTDTQRGVLGQYVAGLRTSILTKGDEDLSHDDRQRLQLYEDLLKKSEISPKPLKEFPIVPEGEPQPVKLIFEGMVHAPYNGDTAVMENNIRAAFASEPGRKLILLEQAGHTRQSAKRMTYEIAQDGFMSYFMFNHARNMLGAFAQKADIENYVRSALESRDVRSIIRKGLIPPEGIHHLALAKLFSLIQQDTSFEFGVESAPTPVAARIKSALSEMNADAMRAEALWQAGNFPSAIEAHKLWFQKRHAVTILREEIIQKEIEEIVEDLSRTGGTLVLIFGFNHQFLIDDLQNILQDRKNVSYQVNVSKAANVPEVEIEQKFRSGRSVAKIPDALFARDKLLKDLLGKAGTRAYGKGEFDRFVLSFEAILETLNEYVSTLSLAEIKRICELQQTNELPILDKVS